MIQKIIDDTEGDLCEEYWRIVEQLKEIIVERRTDADIMIKKVGKKI